MTLVDANILIDLFTDDPDWADWSANALTHCASSGPVGINPVIYAEASIAFSAASHYEAALLPLGLLRWELPYQAGFRAGKAFLDYRRQGGEKSTPLPDFYIGAHAEAHSMQILTRDPRRYRHYFPKVRLVCPD